MQRYMAPQEATNAATPHNGAVTHHQDHEIKLVSFNTTNTMHNKPKKPMPPELLLFESLILLLPC